MQTLFNIPTPCGENWDKMTPTACGRFCNVCQKEVIDITHMTDEAVTQKLEERGGQMCIHAKATQVIAGQVFPRRRLALFALALWAVFSGGLIEEVQGQNNLQTTVQTDTVQYGMVKIKVVDVEDKNNIYGVKVLVRDFENDTLYFTGFTDTSGVVTFPKIRYGKYKLWLRNTYRAKVHISSTTAEMTVHQSEQDFIIEAIAYNKTEFRVTGDVVISRTSVTKETIRILKDPNSFDPIEFNRRYPTRLFGP